MNLIQSLTNLAGDLLPKVEESTTVIAAINAALAAEESVSFASKRFSPGGYVCSRFKAHERLNNFEPRMLPNDADTLRVFKAGNAVHDTVQQSFLGITDKSFGSWRCASCGFTTYNQFRPKMVCMRTRSSSGFLSDIEDKIETCEEVLKKEKIKWRYVEKYVYSNPLNDDLYAISGMIDDIWVESDGTWLTVEIKSIDDLGFRAMYSTKHPEVEGQFVLKPTEPRYPMANHIAQGMVYSKILLDEAREKKLPLDPAKFGGLILLYVNRDTFDMKEFRIAYIEAPYKELLQLATMAKKAVEAKNAMLAPARCSSADAVLAKRCPLRDTCFPKKIKKKL